MNAGEGELSLTADPEAAVPNRGLSIYGMRRALEELPPYTPFIAELFSHRNNGLGSLVAFRRYPFLRFPYALKIHAYKGKGHWVPFNGWMALVTESAELGYLIKTYQHHRPMRWFTFPMTGVTKCEDEIFQHHLTGTIIAGMGPHEYERTTGQSADAKPAVAQLSVSPAYQMRRSDR